MWDELGIEPTGDVLLIRKAYAARLKRVTRSGDRAAFQRLRTAYKQASAIAERISNCAERVEASPAAIPYQESTKISAELLALKSQAMGQPVASTREAGVIPEMHPPDPRSAFWVAVRRAIAVGNTDEAIGLYERGQAQGFLPLGAGAALLDEIMTGPVQDMDLSGARFESLMGRIGWDALGHNASSRVQAIAIDRLDAERWLRHLTEVADSKERLWPLLRKTSLKLWITVLAGRRGEISNARLMLNGGVAFPRRSLITITNLRNQVATYYHFQHWVGGRIPGRAIARAEWLLAVDKRWGRAIRNLWRMAVFGLLLIIIRFLTGDTEQVIRIFYALVVVGFFLSVAIQMIRNVYRWWVVKLFQR